MHASLPAAAALALLLSTQPAAAQRPTEDRSAPPIIPPALSDRAGTPAAGATTPADHARALHVARQRLEAAVQAAAGAPFTYSGEAMTPRRQQLMQATRDAWELVRQAPPALGRTQPWEAAERELRQAFAETTRVQSDREGLDAARRALQVLDRLQATMAPAAGAGPAAPAAGQGGAAPAR